MNDQHQGGPGGAHRALDVLGGAAGTAIDPVCGMSVDPATARAQGLVKTHADIEYVFCGKGCYLDFGDDPERYLDPAYVPSM